MTPGPKRRRQPMEKCVHLAWRAAAAAAANSCNSGPWQLRAWREPMQLTTIVTWRAAQEPHP